MSHQQFIPDANLMQLLMAMGYTEQLATRALHETGNCSGDMAVEWILEHPEGDSDDEVHLLSEDFLDESDFYKMVFVVNSSLKMGLGKLAAQVGHATLGVYKKLISQQQQHGEALLQWEQFGETKIVLKGNDAGHLTELLAKAESLHLPTYLVHDAGRTQIAEGSVTVLGIMGKNNMVDQVTGDLSLLS